MKNTDILAEVLHKAGIRNFFAVTGGAAVHIIDSLVQHTDMDAIFHHHEQAAALAADAYARLGNLGLCVVTTGPGVTNAITGLLCSWQDSVPTIFISGQARYGLTGLNSKVRQVGTQHLEVVPLVQSMTKKALMLQPGDNIREVLTNLIEIAQSGRKGPVWLDIPLDLQIAESEIDTNSFLSTGKESLETGLRTNQAELCADWVSANRPVLLLGRGLAGLNQQEFSNALESLDVPCLRTWGFLDTNLIIPKDLDCGVVGVSGQRGANKLISESDLVVSLGARWGQAVVGPLIDEFAPKAKIHIVDIDKYEIDRVLTALPHARSHCTDAGLFLKIVMKEINDRGIESEWKNYCRSLKTYNFEQSNDATDSQIDQYTLFRMLDEKIGSESSIIIDGGGTIVYCSMQIINLRQGRRVMIPSASAPMGTGIPHAIGAQVSFPERQTIMVTGDGSFPFNIQELQTLVTNNLPIKILIINNQGYLSIQGTQDQFLEGRHLGSAKEGGLDIPNFKKISKAFGIRYLNVTRIKKLDGKISTLLKADGPCILEVFTKEGQEIYPRTGFIKGIDGKFKPQPLSAMYPDLEIPDFTKKVKQII
jgi:acetolactate synthase-1/2/3 large subunit